mgnify:FL=1
MTAILILVGILIVLGLVAYALQRHVQGSSASSEKSDSSTNSKNSDSSNSSECCGLHAVCEKLADTDGDIEYFDDEELDALAGIEATAYTPEQVEQFREVLTTLADGEAPEWLRSLRRRNIALPEDLRDEAMMLVEDVAHNNARTPSRDKSTT